MMKSGRSRDPRFWVSARFLSLVVSDPIYSPNLPKFLISKLALDEDIPRLIPRNQAILRSTPDENPGELSPIGGSQSGKGSACCIGGESGRSLSGGLCGDWYVWWRRCLTCKGRRWTT